MTCPCPVIKVTVTEQPTNITLKNTPIIVSQQVQGVPGKDGIKLVSAEKIYGFPTVGDAETLYCCTGENAVYRWVPALGHYLCVGRDYKEIDIINGGEIA